MSKLSFHEQLAAVKPSNPLADSLPPSVPSGVTDAAGTPPPMDEDQWESISGEVPQIGNEPAPEESPLSTRRSWSDRLNNDQYANKNISQETRPTGVYAGDPTQPLPGSAKPYNDTYGQPENVPDIGGEVMTQEQIYDRMKDDRQKAMERAGVLSLDWRTQEELQNRFGGDVNVTEVGTLHRAAIGLSEAAAKVKVASASDRGVNSTDGFKKLSSAYNTTSTQTTNALAAATSLFMPILSGATKRGSKEATEQTDMYAAMLGGDFNLGSTDIVDGKMKLDTARKLLGIATGSLLSKANNIVDANGNPVDPETIGAQSRANSEEIGGITLQAGVDAGYFNIHQDEDGNKFLLPDPINGVEFYRASKGMAARFNDAYAGRSTTVPSTDTGERRDISRNIRQGMKGRKGAGETEELVESRRILGNTPVVVSQQKSWLAAALFNLGMGYHNGMGIDTTKHAMIHMPDKPTDQVELSKWNNELKTKTSIVKKLLNGFVSAIKENVPRYGVYWEDPTVHRMYQDAKDIDHQSYLLARAVIHGQVKLRNLSKVDFHRTGVSVQAANNWWSDMGNFLRSGKGDYALKNPAAQEMNFLFTVAHALDLGKVYSEGKRETASYLPADLLKLMTPSLMAMYADFGYKLKSIIPQNPGKLANDILDPSKMELTPAQRGVLQELASKSGKKEWGFFAQACMDLDDYLAAKEDGKPFTPKVTTAIDMNSAGRAFLALDIGAKAVLERVGLLWDKMSGEIQNALPFGSPRNYFIQSAVDLGIDSALTSADPELKTMWKELLKNFGITNADKAAGVKPYDQKSFADDFGKKVLMTTDYGKAFCFHIEEAKAFLEDYPLLKRKLMKFYGNKEADILTDLNNIFSQTLLKSSDVWQQGVPKSIVKVLSMFNRVPSPTGYFGEEMFVGGFIDKEIGKTVRIEGVTHAETIALTHKVFSHLAKAKDKNQRDSEGNPIPAPGPGTAAINQMGPILGQYRESALIAMTLLYINKGKQAKDMLFALPVFDNLILDADSAAQFYYVANNIIMPQIAKWDIQKAIYEDFTKQVNTGDVEVRKIGLVDIGADGNYFGVTNTIDNIYQYISDKKESEMNAREKLFVKSIFNNGYVPKDDERSSVVIKPSQHAALVEAVTRYTLTPFGKNLLAEWLGTGLSRKQMILKAMDTLAKEGRIAFFT